MKRLIPLTTCAFFLAGSLFAQEARVDSVPVKPKMTFDVTGAYSMATGKYKATDLEQDDAGYAGGGFMAQIKLNWIGKRDLGLGVSYVFQQNSIRKESQHDTLPGGNPTGLGDKPWNNHYLLAGPVMFKEFSNRVVIDAAILVGIVVASSNVFDMSVPTDSLGNYMISSGAGTGFAWQIRAGVGYRVSKRIVLTAGVNLLGGSPKRTKTNYAYTLVEEPPGSGILVPVYQGYEETIKKKISTFNPGISMIIKL
jgi:hypothetical protein